MLDDDGLSNAESENYNNALDKYDDDLDEYNDKVQDHTGKTIFWMNVGSVFIVGGLVGLAINSKDGEMSNSVIDPTNWSDLSAWWNVRISITPFRRFGNCIGFRGMIERSTRKVVSSS